MQIVLSMGSLRESGSSDKGVVEDSHFTCITSTQALWPTEVNIEQDLPIRPTAICITSSTYGLEKYMSSFVFSLVQQPGHYHKKSEAFITTLLHTRSSGNQHLVSSDMVSLFTKVPLEDTLLFSQQLHNNHHQRPHHSSGG
jgi:hypothetical protein